MRKKKREKQLQKLKESFEESKKSKIEEVSEEDKKILEDLVEKIEEKAKNNDKKFKIKLGKENYLRMETPDVIALKTPRCTLHKSFSDIRFREIRKIENGFEIKIK